jgi:hypothetical protein
MASSLIVLLLLASSRAEAQATAAPPASADPAARPPDYKIAYWYRRSDPLNTFRFRAYDLRKGQYTAAVDRWLQTMQADHPDYAAYVKDLRLKPDSVEGEGKQIATAILQENIAQGGPNGGTGVRDLYGIYGGGLNRLLSPGLGPARPLPGRDDGVSLYSRGYGFIKSPGANRPPGFLASPYQGSQGIPGPFPFPYVRPHP